MSVNRPVPEGDKFNSRGNAPGSLKGVSDPERVALTASQNLIADSSSAILRPFQGRGLTLNCQGALRLAIEFVPFGDGTR